jgi:RimJ/RimL family protein N-acetyltransferase
VTHSLVLETERLILRPLSLADEDDVFIYQSDPDVVRYIPWPVRTRKAVREALARVPTQTRFSETGDFMLHAIVHKAFGKVIGQTNLGIDSKDDRQGEFGYVVSPAFAGQGFATEASRAILDYAFGPGGLHRATARIDTRNAASAAVARKLGMRREAEFIEDEFFKGEWSSSWIYAILASEWMLHRK